VDATQRELHAARQSHAAHFLRGDLRPGEPCPVCAQEVIALPEGGPVPAALDAAEKAATAAARAAKEQAARAAALLGAASSAFATLQAAEEAEKQGVSVEVVDPRTLQPLDEETLVASVRKTNRAVVAHEAVTRMGFGAEIAAVLQYQAFDWLDAPVERVGAKFAPLPFAPVMEEYVVPHANDVLEAIQRTVQRDG